MLSEAKHPRNWLKKTTAETLRCAQGDRPSNDSFSSVTHHQPFMPEAADHFSTINQKAYTVNCLVDTIRARLAPLPDGVLFRFFKEIDAPMSPCAHQRIRGGNPKFWPGDGEFGSTFSLGQHGEKRRGADLKVGATSGQRRSVIKMWKLGGQGTPWPYAAVREGGF